MKNKIKKLSFILVALVIAFVTIIKVGAGVAEKGQLGLNSEVVGDGSKVEITTGNFERPGDIQIKKVVEQTEILGRYKVHFEIRGKKIVDEIETPKPVYVVVVFDKSGSMNEQTNKWSDAVDGAIEFSETLLASAPQARIALVQFSGSRNDETRIKHECVRYETNRWGRRECVLWDDEYEPNDATKTRDFENSAFTDKLFTGAKGGTNLGEGLNMANNLFKNANIPEDAYKYVVVMGDGEPTYYTDTDGRTAGNGNSNNGIDVNSENYAFEKAELLKDNDIEVFSIGYAISNNAHAQSVLRNVASDDNNGITHYYNASSSEVAEAFRSVAVSITETLAGTDGKLTDGIGTQFTLLDGYNNVFNIDEITEEWTVTSPIYIDIDPNSETGWHYTNASYVLNYIDPSGNPASIRSDENPQAYWIQPINITVSKSWEDHDNMEKLRPESVTVRLLADGREVASAILSSENEWSYTFEKLDKHRLEGQGKDRKAVEINYTIVEDAVNGYEASYEKNENNIVVTNTHEIETTNIVVNKKWVNAEIFGNKLPNIIVKLSYRENSNDSWKELDTKVIGEKDNWTYSWNKAGDLDILPKSFEYKVEEIGFEGIDNAEEIFNNFFDKSVSNKDNIFTITNKCKATFELPETGSSMMLIMIISMVVLFGTPIMFSIYTFMRRYI